MESRVKGDYRIGDADLCIDLRNNHYLPLASAHKKSRLCAWMSISELTNTLVLRQGGAPDSGLGGLIELGAELFKIRPQVHYLGVCAAGRAV